MSAGQAIGNFDLLTEIFRGLVALQEAGLVAQNEQLGDIEFSMEVAQHMDPEDREFIDPRKVRYHPTLVPHTGTQAINGLRATTPETLKFEPGILPSGTELVLSPGFIDIIGMQNANPVTLSHEFRHQAYPLEVPNWLAETVNRMEDVHHRGPIPGNAQDAVRGLHDWYARGNMVGYEGTFPEVLKQVMEHMMKVHQDDLGAPNSRYNKWRREQDENVKRSRNRSN